MKAEISKETILNNFANNATPLQQKQIENWLKLKSNEEFYYKVLEEWENSNLEYSPNSEILITNYSNLINNGLNPTDNKYSVLENSFLPKKTIWFKWAIASSIVLVIGIGFLLFKSVFQFKTYETSYGEVKSFILADGTQVILNANSFIQVPRWGFGDSNREVFLQGEADFSVTHSKTDQKFIVKTGKNFEVVVLGTEFSVFSRQRGSNIALKKGKVLINYKEDKVEKRILMKPGELVSFNKNNHPSIKVALPTSNFSLWIEKRFVFDETNLSEVAQMLEETYGLKVSIDNNKLSERKIMGSFRAENVDELLFTIAELLDINVVRQGDKVQLSEK